jgi:hypothetical protein
MLVTYIGHGELCPLLHRPDAVHACQGGRQKTAEIIADCRCVGIAPL